MSSRGGQRSESLWVPERKSRPRNRGPRICGRRIRLSLSSVVPLCAGLLIFLLCVGVLINNFIHVSEGRRMKQHRASLQEADTVEKRQRLRQTFETDSKTSLAHRLSTVLGHADSAVYTWPPPNRSYEGDWVIEHNKEQLAYERGEDNNLYRPHEHAGLEDEAEARAGSGLMQRSRERLRRGQELMGLAESRDLSQHKQRMVDDVRRRIRGHGLQPHYRNPYAQVQHAEALSDVNARERNQTTPLSRFHSVQQRHFRSAATLARGTSEHEREHKKMRERRIKKDKRQQQHAQWVKQREIEQIIMRAKQARPADRERSAPFPKPSTGTRPPLPAVGQAARKPSLTHTGSDHSQEDRLGVGAARGFALDSERERMLQLREQDK